VFVKHIFAKKFWRTSEFREIFKNVSAFYPCYNHEMWIMWQRIVHRTHFCEKFLADFTVS